MLTFRKRTHSSGLHLSLCRLQPAVRRVFEIAGFTELFDLHATVEEAMGEGAGYTGPPALVTPPGNAILQLQHERVVCCSLRQAGCARQRLACGSSFQP